MSLMGYVEGLPADCTDQITLSLVSSVIYFLSRGGGREGATYLNYFSAVFKNATDDVNTNFFLNIASLQF